MSLIVEDGSNVSGAESYCSVADATTYHANRGNAAWALLSATQQEQALRKATGYMLQVYRLRWQGFRQYNPQALDWPRTYVPIPDVISGYGRFTAYVPYSTVPNDIKNACAEFALRAAAGDLLADMTQMVEHEEVGPIKVSYNKYSPQRVRYPAIESMLRPYLVEGGASNPLVRV